MKSSSNTYSPLSPQYPCSSYSIHIFSCYLLPLDIHFIRLRILVHAMLSMPTRLKSNLPPSTYYPPSPPPQSSCAAARPQSELVFLSSSSWRMARRRFPLSCSCSRYPTLTIPPHFKYCTATGASFRESSLIVEDPHHTRIISHICD